MAASGFAALLALGQMQLRSGAATAAVDSFRRALRLRPNLPDGHFYLGNALLADGQAGPAIRAFRRTLVLRPGHAAATNNLGHALLGQGLWDEAAGCFAQLVAAAPDNADALASMGYAHQAAGRLDAAADSFAAAVRLQPDRADFWRRAGEVAILRGAMAAAAEYRGRAAALLPQDAQLQVEWGDVLAPADRHEAAACYRRALRLRPDHLGALIGLTEALCPLGRFAEAETALRAFPDADASRGARLTLLGDVLRNQMRLDEAASVLEEARRWAPDRRGAEMTLGLVRLLQGDYARGFALYEGRFAGTVWLPALGSPRWQGEALGGGTLLVVAEQGLGDTVQFCRFAARAGAQAGGPVVVMAPASLVRLLGTLAGVSGVVALGGAVPDHAAHVPMMSLPGVLGTEDFGGGAYLRADPEGAAAWRARLAGLPGRRIGLCWSGAADNTHDAMRSVPFAALRGLLAVPGCSFVSLQKRPAGAAAVAGLADFGDALGDFADTAGLLAGLDLVISVDTAVAHVAGALGRPVWLLNRFNTDWRWLVRLADSPWYAGHVIFRQERAGDWEGVLGVVVGRLMG